MKKAAMIATILVLTMGLTACGSTGKADPDTKTDQNATTEQEVPEEQKMPDEQGASDEQGVPEEMDITEDQALEAVKEYCHINNPDLKDIEDDEEYPTYWEVSTNEDNQIVVLFRSYTGALVRYYVDPTTGETYVTEFVPGITDEEERTDESFNIKDYMKPTASVRSAVILNTIWTLTSPKRRTTIFTSPIR